jgi:hypothetical protein
LGFYPVAERGFRDPDPRANSYCGELALADRGVERLLTEPNLGRDFSYGQESLDFKIFHFFPPRK